MTVKVTVLGEERRGGDTVSEFLRAEGFEVVKHEGRPAEALDLLRQNRADVVILDTEGKSIGDSLRMAKEAHRSLAVPTIFLSSDPDQDIIDRIVESEGDLVIGEGNEVLRQLPVRIRYAMKRRPMRNQKKMGIMVLPHVTKQKAESKRDNLPLPDDIRTMPRISLRYDLITSMSLDIYDKHFVQIETVAGTMYNHTYSLKKLESILPDNFLRIERGCIVNLDHLTARINGRYIEIGGRSCPIGINYLEIVKSRLSERFD